MIRTPYLLHVAAQFGVRRLVDFVPVHRDLDLLVQLEDDEGVIDVSVTHIRSVKVLLAFCQCLKVGVSPS